MTVSILHDRDYEWLQDDGDGHIDFDVVNTEDLTISDREEIDRELTRLVMSIQAQQQERNAAWLTYKTDLHDRDEYREANAAYLSWKARAETLKKHAVAAKQINKDLLHKARPAPTARKIGVYTETITGADPAESATVAADPETGQVVLTVDDGNEFWDIRFDRRAAEALGLHLIRTTTFDQEETS